MSVRVTDLNPPKKTYENTSVDIINVSNNGLIEVKYGESNLDSATKFAATTRMKVIEVIHPIKTFSPLWLDDNKSDIVVPESFSYFL